MSQNDNNSVPDFDGWSFSVNINKIPENEVAKHAGKHVAYSLDGTQILASGQDDEEVDKKLIAAGIQPSRVVHSYLPSPEEHTLL